MNVDPFDEVDISGPDGKTGKKRQRKRGSRGQGAYNVRQAKRMAQHLMIRARDWEEVGDKACWKWAAKVIHGG